ncbi:MAG: glycosyltransferase family 4 protein, partial [Kiritimatiellaeota bacterium]|nr:glycosyltransferase family 4 protein [Kiritimatiellota bacterium]
AFLLRRGRDFDLIHVHTSEWIAGFAVWLGRRLRCPVLCKVATLPALPALSRRVPFGRAWDRLRRQAEFVALNEAMAAELRAAGVPEQRVRVVPNSVELPDCSGRREDTDLVLFVGNLTQHEYKAFDTLFDAWALVHAEHPSARLAVLGGGDPTPWERYLDARGCRAAVVFEGFVRDVNTWYARAAVLVLPSRQEGMSNALLEAQSWGVPAVVSDIPANLAVVSDGENGLVAAVNDADALAAGMLRLLRDARLRADMGAAARRRTEQRYALEVVADRTCAVYETLVRGTAGARETKDASGCHGNLVRRRRGLCARRGGCRPDAGALGR